MRRSAIRALCGLATAAALAGLTACASPGTADPSMGTTHTIPHNVRHSQPAPSGSPSLGASGPISADQASLDQLWALEDSSLRTGGEMNGRAAGQIDQTTLDFENAITSRCEPNLPADKRSALESLWASVVQQSKNSTSPLHDVEKAYFDAATRECM